MILDKLLGEVRAEVNLAPWRYDGQSNNGYCPLETPLVGKSDGEIKAINSEGRSALIEKNGKVYKLKGIDPHASISTQLWKSGKVKVTQDSLCVQFYEMVKKLHKELGKERVGRLVKIEGNPIYEPLSETFEEQSIIQCGLFHDRAFGVLTKKAAQIGLEINGLISEYYEELGYNAPLKPVDVMDFNRLFFGDEQTSCLICELPTKGSDLRIYELRRLLRKQNAENKDLFNIYRKLMRWDGFSSRVLYDLELTPHPDSYSDQNCMVAELKKGKIGLVRNDHTSTKRKREKESYYKQMIDYTLPLDRAKGKREKSEELKEEFNKGFRKGAEPIDEKEVAELFEN